MANNKQQRARSAREVALDALVRIERDGAYSNLELNRALQQAELPRADAGLATELVYGTVQRMRTLDYWLERFVAKGLAKLQPWVLALLRMSVYQMVYLDRVPPHAAVNEAVTIAKRRGHAGISGMVNGVLRNVDRRRSELTLPESATTTEAIALKHSYPDWLAGRWVSEYGAETAEAICAAGNEPPNSSIRINPLRAGRDAVLAALKEEGLYAAPSPLSPNGIVVVRGGNLADRIEYRNGQWTVQDESSMLVSETAAPSPGMTVLDCCAAPGGKSTHLAELMEDRGTVWSNDIHPHKEKLIAAQAERLGLSCIRTTVGDAAELPEKHPDASMDLVLLDAPCSGFGVIRRKPEIKWAKSPVDVDAIAGLQTRLLEAAARLVKVGGTLVYSTCTIERRENEGQIERFLAGHAEFELDPDWPPHVLDALREAGVVRDDAAFPGMVQLLPQHFGSDGFFIARLRRR
ncbi:16S rRNA methyltransferase [Paenibacillus darwinianus]|uniref:16S rRNA (cytosine(967)-C(5))-methyltransferase n=1 Tax=Paenibacillus darwinianus TaxID=1380763 RepID=A0A9W5W6K7_9BACL|nr:16S rRNA (cytosine(967)-C(5))-methyltransferase RsmB [Paenibacillus darwinianus]EXX84729.1 16S rRNA methyltransferase [Paenibacillus darwinianus]EXX85162.1 16S rRNA methyltransferase [Paenibacillus darwinianus]EXX89685.1 16S rRNA methyltransferase [Paenibacillus darwinianus]